MSTIGDPAHDQRRGPRACRTRSAPCCPQLALAVDLAVNALSNGHRVHYVGAGTSGRLASVDAAELPPTYNVPPHWFVPHHAGGAGALRQAVENAEDDDEAGAREIRDDAQPGDFVLGLTASGRTPYVLGALAAARQLGARTALVSGNPDAQAGGRGRANHRRHRARGDRRVDADEGGQRAEADPDGVLDGCRW